MMGMMIAYCGVNCMKRPCEQPLVVGNVVQFTSRYRAERGVIE